MGLLLYTRFHLTVNLQHTVIDLMRYANTGMFIVECPVGRFSVNCRSECHCQNASEQCSQELGLCQSGCDHHWTGIGCQGLLLTYEYCLLNELVSVIVDLYMAPEWVLSYKLRCFVHENCSTGILYC